MRFHSVTYLSNIIDFWQIFRVYISQIQTKISVYVYQNKTISSCLWEKRFYNLFESNLPSFNTNVLCITYVLWFGMCYIFEYYVIFILTFFFNVQNWDLQQARDSCLKINKYYVIFKNSKIWHIPIHHTYVIHRTLFDITKK